MKITTDRSLPFLLLLLLLTLTFTNNIPKVESKLGTDRHHHHRKEKTHPKPPLPPSPPSDLSRRSTQDGQTSRHPEDSDPIDMRMSSIQIFRKPEKFKGILMPGYQGGLGNGSSNPTFVDTGKTKTSESNNQTLESKQNSGSSSSTSDITTPSTTSTSTATSSTSTSTIKPLPGGYVPGSG
ncbi:hypothetical protein IE53DRAFT_391332, partial [Violaceomyces palustris]